ncbi:unnamed protein product [Amoebophrya sp. A25]|nr:unnamed protein product [Amoebophrya sp. A25]|eukprot:GSA25T00009237001.1
MGCGASKAAAPAATAPAAPVAASTEATGALAKEAAPASKTSPAATTKDSNKEYLTKVFHQFDTDFNGVMSKKELKRALRCLGLKSLVADIDEVFAKFLNKPASETTDADVITVDQWVEFIPKEMCEKIEGRLNDQDMVEGFLPLVDVAKIFEQFDTDGSGTLTVKELKRALAALGLKEELQAASTSEGAEKWAEMLNADDNGEVNMDAWKAGLSKDFLRKISTKLDDRGLVASFKDDGRKRKEKTSNEEAPANAPDEAPKVVEEEAPAEEAAAGEAAPAEGEAPPAEE